jgi:hypothetical protein
LQRLAFGEPDVRLDLANGEQHGLSGQRESDVCYVAEVEQTVPVLMQMVREVRTARLWCPSLVCNQCYPSMSDKWRDSTLFG